MKLTVFFRKAVSLFALLPFCLMGVSQGLYTPKIQSPNAASLGTFTETPVNMFTGTPNISIPLYNLTYGTIKVPVNLRYNSSAVKPSQQPGWVGSGWDIESIGTITRQAHGPIDELYPQQYMDNNVTNISYYYFYPGETVHPGSYFANLPDWSSATQLANDLEANGSSNPAIDALADEFSFNVMGHSGKFYWEDNAFKVVSDEHIIVQLSDMFSPTDVVNGIKEYLPTFGTSVSVYSDQSRAFGSFTLIMPDGSKFVFGGRDGSGAPDAVEFSSPIPASRPGGGSQDQTYTANTWLLKSITDANGDKVTFNYTKLAPICNIGLNANFTQGQISQTDGSGLIQCSGGFGNIPPLYPTLQNQLSASMLWPLYLSEISCPNEHVDFSFSQQLPDDVNTPSTTVHAYNGYTTIELMQTDISDNNTHRDLTLLDLGNDPKTILNRLKWMQLNKVIITDVNRNPSINNGQPNIIKQYQFNYLNNSGNLNQRLMLGSLQVLDKYGTGIGQYGFTYNQDLNNANISINGTSIYADGNYSDHWGFYNGVNVTASPVDIYNGKQPNRTRVTSELLSQITYPTGGYTKFTWESNDYSQVVPPTSNRQPLQPWQNFSSSLTGYGGGCRIAEIKDFLADNSVAADKHYYYVTGYSAGTDPGTLPSSGVLNGIPQYDFSITGRPGSGGPNVVGGVHLISLDGTGNYGYTGQGSPIGYKEVVEVNADGSYTKNQFTNFDADLNGVTHYDVLPIGSSSWRDGDTYYPFTSLELERGKPIGAFVYTSNNILLKKTITTYRNDAARFNKTINLIDAAGSYASSTCPAIGFAFATARPVFTYSYYPINKTVTIFDQLGSNPVLESTDLTYDDDYDLLTSSSLMGSQGEKIKHSYSYSFNFSSDPTFQAMADPSRNIISPIIQDAATYQAQNSTAVPTKLIYTPYTVTGSGLYLPQNTQIQIAGNSIEIRERFYQYDSHGNIQEIAKDKDAHDVYIWGYNSQYVVAKITNSTYSAVQSAMATAGITQSQLDQVSMGLSDNDMRNLLNGLRGIIPGAFVTTYTYACGVGMTSQTDPNGKTMYYEYDPLGRLWDVRDQDKNIIKKFCYNYAGQPEVCNLYGNQEMDATYSRQGCPANTSPGTYTYTVPAKKYFAYTQQQADLLASNDVSANGQNAANANAPCNPWVSMPVVMNSGGDNPNWIISVQFYQGATLVSNFTFDNTGGTVYAPAGTYTVVVSQINNYPRTVHIDGYDSQTGTVATFTNVVMSGASFGGTLTVN